MLLALSLGNTTLRWILWDGPRPAARGTTAVADLGRAGALDGLADAARSGRAVLASVNPPAEPALLAALVGARESLARIGAEVRVPLRTRVREPARVGADRLCDALAAYSIVGGAAVVVDAGTAVTVGAVTSAGEFLGGAIAPGPRLAGESLRRGTALLPESPGALPARVLGLSTEEAIAAGVSVGGGGAVRALVGGALHELGEPARVVGTGGDLARLAGIADLFDRVEPDLTLIGIRLAAESPGR
ncbi:MAG: type III pantothenate kinase [Planctomycetales bacterium]|nr:type III pantothenate kinase [Planctomycetales bacterium]